MVDQVRRLIGDLLDHASYFLFFLFVFVILTSFSPALFLQALGAIDAFLPQFISDYFASIHVTSKQLFSLYYILSVITISSLILFLIQVRIGQTWIYTQKLFEKCILVCSYFLMINMILSNLNLPTANLGKLMESNINFFYLVFPALTTGLVGMIFMYIIIPSIFMVISPTRFKDRFK
ncbi:hypothetical protein [Virgibacillus alimentarius]|uniref:hypothetical protein n=1 Tax=Virgibacillus alimentarius TaxID=698769 RepID=UPI000493B4C7|nr:MULTISPECIES: hypothetical protein [Virgibacillus]HLR69375.1 hypothetical protein [Virgibacillus sp.]